MRAVASYMLLSLAAGASLMVYDAMQPTNNKGLQRLIMILYLPPLGLAWLGVLFFSLATVWR